MHSYKTTHFANQSSHEQTCQRTQTSRKLLRSQFRGCLVSSDGNRIEKCYSNHPSDNSNRHTNRRRFKWI